MTNTEIQTLYNTAITTSFGYFYVQVCNQIAVHYQCKSTANCTSDEIASL